MRLSTQNQTKRFNDTHFMVFKHIAESKEPGGRREEEGGRSMIRKPSLMDSSPRTHTGVGDANNDYMYRQ